MDEAIEPTRRETIAGWIVSGLVILFLVMDAGMKLVPIQPVFDTMKTLGWPSDPALMRLLGVLTLVPAKRVLPSILAVWSTDAPGAAVTATCASATVPLRT